MTPAMTIVELMVALATLALLLGLLLPALSGVQAAGRRTVCTSNLRQMAIAAQGYALEYGFFPPALRYENDGDVTQVAWDWVTTLDGRLVSPGALWSYADDPGKVQQCPSHHGQTNFKGDPHTGYNYNTTFVGGEGAVGSWGWENFRPGVRYSACRRTARVAVFGDGGWAGGTNKFMRAPMNQVESDLDLVYAGGQAFRHQKSTNVAYMDGHVGTVNTPSEGLLATPRLLRDTMDYPRNGFLSQDDRAYDPR
jgi:prepilin-type processing-associated H-X9-DG protein